MNPAHHRASFLAASSQHSGDWLFAPPIEATRSALYKSTATATTNSIMWIEARRIGCKSGSWFEVGFGSLHTTPVPLRLTSGCPWAPQLRVQNSPWQVS